MTLFLPDIEPIKKRLSEIDTQLSNPDTFKDNKLASSLSREHQQLSKIVNLHIKWLNLQQQEKELSRLLENEVDKEMLSLAQLEKEDVKQQLKIQSAKLGVKQIDLVNRYVIEGIRRDTLVNIKSIVDIERLLSYDKPEGNNLKSFVNLIDNDEPIDPVEEKKSAYRGY